MCIGASRRMGRSWMGDVRKTLDIPYQDFPKVIKFWQDHARAAWIAMVDGEVVGECNLAPSDEVVLNWKIDVFKKLAHMSRTVELKTACGCSRLAEVEQRQRDYRVPLKPTTMKAFATTDAFDPMATMPVRDFRHRRLNADGLRLFEEHVP